MYHVFKDAVSEVESVDFYFVLRCSGASDEQLKAHLKLCQRNKAFYKAMSRVRKQLDAFLAQHARQPSTMQKNEQDLLSLLIRRHYDLCEFIEQSMIPDILNLEDEDQSVLQLQPKSGTDEENAQL